MTSLRIYFATLIGPALTGLIFILIDGLNSSDFINYLYREAKQTWMFIILGLIIAIIGIKIFSKNLNNQTNEIYLYWVKLYSLVLFSLYLLELGRWTFTHEVKNLNVFFSFLPIIALMPLPFLLFGLILGIIYTPIIKLIINKNWP